MIEGKGLYTLFIIFSIFYLVDRLLSIMKMTRWRTSYAQMITERLGVSLESEVRVITKIKKYYNEKKYNVDDN